MASLVKAARNSEKSSVAAKKGSAKKGAAEKGAAKKGSTTEAVVKKTKRKEPPGSEESATEPVVKRAKRASSPGDPRSNLKTLTSTAKKNTVVAESTKLQIKVKNNTLYNTTVTKVLNDELVKVCAKDDCRTIAKMQFRIVRLTKEQAKSGKVSGFTKGCASRL